MAYKKEIQPDDALWQMVVRSFGGTNANVQTLHPLDEQRIVQMCRELWALGERPSVPEFRAFVREVWPDTHLAQFAPTVWKRIVDNPHHKFRGQRRSDRRLRAFHKHERLAEQHGLESVPDRLQRVFMDASERYAAATQADDADMYEARRTLFAAVEAIEDYRAGREHAAASFSRHSGKAFRGAMVEQLTMHWPRPD